MAATMPGPHSSVAVSPRTPLLLTAALLSGGAALVHQVLWVRRLGDTLGHGSVAVAIVLATFFAGMGIGARLFGPLADRARRPGLWYAALEVGIAAWGVAFLPLVAVVEDAFFALVSVDTAPAWRGAIAALVASALLLPPCVLLGGTLPVLARVFVGADDDAFGRRVATLYGVNTIGAAAGAALAGFVLLPGLGIANALGVAAAANLFAGALVVPLRAAGAPAPRVPAPRAVAEGSAGFVLVAAVSGFVGIGLEIVWTRALAARLSSTVYSFATLLAVFLLALGIGGIAVAWWERRRGVTARTVGLLLVATAVAGLLSTWAIDAFGELRRASGADVGRIRSLEVVTAMLVMLPPCLCLGATFPALARLVHSERERVGTDVGRVFLGNTAGSVLAALVVGFGALPSLGLTGTVLALAAIASATGIVLLPRPDGEGLRPFRVHLGAAGVVAVAAVVGTTDLRSWRSSAGDRLIAYREGRAASVAVVDQADGNRVLKVDRTYRLGGVRGRYPQARQGLVPLLLHGGARSALSIGIGTGGSVGAAAAFGTMDGGPLRLDAVEILPEVVEMLPHFDAWNHDLTLHAEQDPATRIVVADARHFVRAARGGRYDVVFGDLFVPWRPGEGEMYTREHFAAVRDVLAPGGVFVQWLPLYQLGTRELRTIVATFVGVFPERMAIWLYFNANTPTLGLCGGRDPIRLRPDLERAWDEPMRARLLASAGLRGPEDVAALWLCDAEALAGIAAGTPVETIARPRVEFSAARWQPVDKAVLAEACLRMLLPRVGDPAGADLLAGLDDAGVPEPVLARHRASLAALVAAFAAAHGSGPSGEIDGWIASVRADPTWTYALDRLDRAATRALRSGRFEDAARVVAACRAEPALELRGLRLLARLREAEGHRDAAIAACRAVLDRDPDDAATRDLLERMLQ